MDKTREGASGLPNWVHDAVFYQIFPDRFASSSRVDKTGLHLEPWDTPPTVFGFKGGDLRGVTEHLDYLQDLGVNALYFTPVFCSASNHRYHTYDYLHVDPLLGGDDALQELLGAAHARQMRVVLDGVFNHASRGFWQFHHTLENGDGSPYKDWFHFDPERLSRNRHWGAYPSPAEQHAIERDGSYKAIGYQGWWNLPALPKFNTANPKVREFLWGVAEHWTRQGIDGWRLDVPGEIDDDSFWQEFRLRVRAINPDAYIVGEIWHDARRWLCGDQFDGTMNYMVTAACLSFFPAERLDLELTLRTGGFRGHVQHIDAPAFGGRLKQQLQQYGAEVSAGMLNLLDSHDTSRFLSACRGDVPSLRLALTFLLTYVGAPCIFYGDEIGVTGGQDPECRPSFPWEPGRWNRPLLNYTKELIALRNKHAALRRGNFEPVYAAGQAYAFSRAYEGEKLLIALNAGNDATQMEIGSKWNLDGAQVLLGDIHPESFHHLEMGARSSAVLLLH